MNLSSDVPAQGPSKEDDEPTKSTRPTPVVPRSTIAQSLCLGDALVIPKAPSVPKIEVLEPRRKRRVRTLPHGVPRRASGTSLRPLHVSGTWPAAGRPDSPSQISVPPAPPAETSVSVRPVAPLPPVRAASVGRGGRVIAALALAIVAAWLALVASRASRARGGDAAPTPLARPVLPVEASFAWTPVSSHEGIEPALRPFDNEAASKALTEAAARARECRRGSALTRAARAIVSFDPSGHVLHARLELSFPRADVGQCVMKELRATTIPPYAGKPVTVTKRLLVP